MLVARVGRRALTRRERDVALLLAQGCQPAQVAIALGINTRVVQRHISAIRAKLGVRSRGQSWLRHLGNAAKQTRA